MRTLPAVLAGGAALMAIAGANAADNAVSPLDLVQPISDYKIYVVGEVDTLVGETRRFADAIKSGDLAAARALYAPTRIHYERIEPIAELFSDLDVAIDSRADDHEKQEADETFTGFHRLEYLLFSQRSLADAGPFADRLVADVLDLQARVKGLTVPPDKMVGGAAALIEEVAASKISGEEDRYSGTDLWDFQANVDGAEKIVDLLRPLTEKADPALSQKIDANFASVDAILAKYALPGGGYEDYSKLSEADRTALQGPVTTLAEDLSSLEGTLGLE
jgi:iron uptake system component EfeO